MSIDIKKPVVEAISIAPLGLLLIQFFESMSVESCSQLMAFVRHIHSKKLKEEFVSCATLTSST